LRNSPTELFAFFAIVTALGAGTFVVLMTRAPYDAFATGTVAELVPRRPGAESASPIVLFKDDYLTRVRFTTADGREVTVTHDRSKKAWREFRVGDAVQVNYDSADPQQFVLPMPGERASILWPVALAWLLVNGGFAIGLRVTARRRFSA
jgi:hypothetical protein